VDSINQISENQFNIFFGNPLAPQKSQRRASFMKGVFELKPDFDEPLEIFNDYIPQ